MADLVVSADVDSLMSCASKSAMRQFLGVGNDVNVIYLRSNGNDTTGDGTSGKPFATIQKAWDSKTTTALYVDLGASTSSYGNLTVSGNALIFIRGLGAFSEGSSSSIGNITNSTLHGELHIFMDGVQCSNIISNGGVIVVSGNGIIYSVASTPSLVAENAGENAGNITLKGNLLVQTNVIANGAAGFDGSPEQIGGIGGNGGYIVISNGVEILSSISASRGNGGADGGGGAGGYGSNGSISVYFSTIPDIGVGEGIATIDTVACIVNGVFVAS